MDFKYIVGDDIAYQPRNDRPTQAEIKNWEIGTYTLYRSDASVAKVYTVTLNRNGNPTVSASPPDTLRGLNSHKLNRLARAFSNVVKLWPEKSRDLDKVNKIIEDRRALLENLSSLSEAVDWSEEVEV